MTQVWRQQNSARWHDNPLIAQDCCMLSPDCTDLLNRMFDLDEASRCVVAGSCEKVGMLCMHVARGGGAIRAATSATRAWS
jgi:hypothetical protein